MPLDNDLRQPQSLAPRQTIRIKIGHLTDAHRTMPTAMPKALMIRRRSMIRAPVIPNGHIIDILPSVPDLQVVVFHQQLDEPIFQHLALVFGHAVELLEVVSDGVERFPACDGVRANDGMDGCEFVSDLRSFISLVVMVREAQLE